MHFGNRFQGSLWHMYAYICQKLTPDSHEQHPSGNHMNVRKKGELKTLHDLSHSVI